MLRAKDIYRKIGAVIIPPLGALLMRLLYMTYKFEYNILGKLPQRNCVFVGWHGELFVNPLVYRKFRKNYKTYAVISHHFDGELIAKTFWLAGKIDALRGSSRKGAKAVLVQAIKQIQKGDDIILTPDGPRGPRHSFQPGALAIAKRAEGNLVIITMKADKFWQFQSWDKFVIPKPFSKVEVFMQVLQLKSFDEASVAMVQEKMLTYAH